MVHSEDSYPCSVVQEIYLKRKNGEGQTNMPILLRAVGKMNTLNMRESVHAIIERHCILRTTFFYFDNTLYQRVQENFSIEIPLFDVTCKANPLQDAFEEISRDRKIPFNLYSQIPIRGKIYRIAEWDHLISLIIDHIAIDGISAGILVNEMRQLYRALGEGRMIEFEPRPKQYRNFACWQREWILGEGQKQLNYWVEKLAQQKNLHRPSMYQQRGISLYICSRKHFRLQSETSAAFKLISKNRQVTPFTVVLAAYSIALADTTGETDLVIQNLRANRSRPSAKEVVGPFFNSISLQISLNYELSSEEFLFSVRRICRESYKNEEIPFQIVLGALEDQYGISSNKLLEYAINFIPFSQGEQQKWNDDLCVAQLWYHHLGGDNLTTCRVSLTLSEMEAGHEGTLFYDKESFNENWANAFIEKIENIISNIAGNIETPLTELLER